MLTRACELPWNKFPSPVEQWTFTSRRGTHTTRTAFSTIAHKKRVKSPFPF